MVVTATTGAGGEYAIHQRCGRSGNTMWSWSCWRFWQWPANVGRPGHFSFAACAEPPPSYRCETAKLSTKWGQERLDTHIHRAYALCTYVVRNALKLHQWTLWDLHVEPTNIVAQNETKRESDNRLGNALASATRWMNVFLASVAV